MPIQTNELASQLNGLFKLPLLLNNTFGYNKPKTITMDLDLYNQSE